MIISFSGIRGILLNTRNIPIMSMPIESMLLAVNLNFLVFSVSSDDMMGQSFASLVPTVAAAESAIGLAMRQERLQLSRTARALACRDGDSCRCHVARQVTFYSELFHQSCIFPAKLLFTKIDITCPY
ncbi:putative NADH:ubiquinone reductase (H(+)-translocating) [Helianthus annuus]|uniref:NADH:ubiquinone reductase (H(+)-translocating) n=1 Tax=Helianthus annuus TaxID=4232 RepID=A0A251T8I5_HELAN|nr:putative NADH:ubiquinone reductase (H(+)-translocating) [Helianthus annuus]KAJ0500342.1 putative NADH:ubiquinone reductase (H(+)-translocating) [Helianthus annuus]KAJ0507750.1 putative NADH:ubiquinone reductase (H(+)-translocating) [Helianthus annuus]KAJ0516174.1 putative NADH:ubiquinone reductase (H(+)-translocating) [Helianthus annuus]KAJ0684200.1 putative NADH:ubiquinone reductase (H(+)-translocating) [Helianthus annuus]